MKTEKNEMQTFTEFMESATAAALEVKRLKRRREELQKRKAALRIQNGAAADRLARLISTEQRREKELAEKEMERYQSVERFLNRIPAGMHQTVLRRRYLDMGRSWEQIRKELSEDGVIYSQRHLLRLHSEALEEAQKLWNKEREEGAVKRR